MSCCRCGAFTDFYRAERRTWKYEDGKRVRDNNWEIRMCIDCVCEVAGPDIVLAVRTGTDKQSCYAIPC